MKMARYILVVLVVGMIFGGVLVAQETLPPTVCTQEDYLTLQTGISNLIGGLSDNTLYDPTTIMLQVRTAIETYQLLCNQMFTNVTHPNGIIGPIAFDGTLYEVTFVTPLSESPGGNLGGNLSMTTISGDCGFINTILTSGISPEETDLFKFGGDCVGMIEVNRAVGAWELSFVKIK